MDNALCMFEMILSPYGGREVCFSPLRAMSTRRFPIESYISVVWRRPTAPGMTGPCHIHHNPPPLSGTEDRSAYRYALATLLRWKASAPALGIHAFSSPRLTSKDFFAPGFWLVTYIREHSAAFDGRSPRIRVTCAFAPMWMDRARAPSCDSDDPALTLLVCSRRQQSFRAPPYFDVVYSGFIPRWRMAARSWTAKHE